MVFSQKWLQINVFYYENPKGVAQLTGKGVVIEFINSSSLVFIRLPKSKGKELKWLVGPAIMTGDLLQSSPPHPTLARHLYGPR